MDRGHRSSVPSYGTQVRGVREILTEVADRIRAEGPLVAVLGAAGWVAWPLFGQTPLTQDHPVHIFQAWHFWSEMLARGRLRGWSHVWAFGLPSGELTPFGSDLWVALFRALSFGQLSWARTYALALVGLMVFSAWAMWRFARRFFGVPVGMLAALGWVLDPGAPFEGGWEWSITWGVWPVTLGLSWVMLALASLDAALAEPRRRHVFTAAGCMALSIGTHQLSLVVLVVGVPMLLLDHWIRPEGFRPGAVLRTLAAVGLAVGWSAFYLFPLLARADVTLDLGQTGVSLADLAKKLIDMRLFGNMWPPTLLLGLVGMLFALRRRRAGGLFFVASAGTFVLLSSDVLLDVLHFERLTTAVLKLEAHRMLLVAKVFWFPLAGHALVVIVRRPRDALKAPRSRARRVVWWSLPAVLFGPLLVPSCHELYRTQIAKSVARESSLPYWNDLRALWAWSASLRQGTTDFYRIAYRLPVHDHLSTLAPLFDRTLYYKVGYTPVHQFRSSPMSGEPELLEALSVKYLVSDQEQSSSDFSLEREFGRLRVYRFARYHAQPFTLIGAGQAELERFDPELIQIEIRGTTTESRIKLHVANYDRWQATLDGKPVSIAPAPVHDRADPILMEVPATDGKLVLRYVRRLPDWLGLGVSLLALPLYCLLAWWAPRTRARWLGVAIEQLRRWRPALRISGWMAAAVLGGWVVKRLAFSPCLLPEDSLFRELPPGSLSLAGEPCQSFDSLTWQCGPHLVKVAVVRGEGLGLSLCLTAPPAGELVLTRHAVLGRFIEARYRSLPGSGRFGLAVGDQLHAEASTRPSTREDRAMEAILFDTRQSAGKGAASLRLEVGGAALHCFDVRKIP